VDQIWLKPILEPIEGGEHLPSCLLQIIALELNETDDS